MVTVEITPEEVQSGAMTPEHLATATTAVRKDGFVVLKDVVDLQHIAMLRDRMIADVEALKQRKDAPFNWNTGNVQQEPPPFPPYLFRDVLVNEMVIAVTHALLGDGVTNAYYSGNTAVQSDQRQPVHADTGQLWADMEVASPPYSLVVNVPTVTMSAENGSTEIWAGTHTDTSVHIHGSIEVTPAALERWHAIRPPIQPTMEAGSVLIRDIRLWHAGMPNRTDRPRPMIAMIHHASWYGHQESLKFPKGTEELFAHPILRTKAVFVEEPIDYIHSPQAYAYDHENR